MRAKVSMALCAAAAVLAVPGAYHEVHAAEPEIRPSDRPRVVLSGAPPQAAGVAGDPAVGWAAWTESFLRFAQAEDVELVRSAEVTVRRPGAPRADVVVLAGDTGRRGGRDVREARAPSRAPGPVVVVLGPTDAAAASGGGGAAEPGDAGDGAEAEGDVRGGERPEAEADGDAEDDEPEGGSETGDAGALEEGEGDRPPPLGDPARSEPVRPLPGAERSILVDLDALVLRARRAGLETEGGPLVARGGDGDDGATVVLTARGAMLAGRATALGILAALGRIARPPTAGEVFSESGVPVPSWAPAEAFLDTWRETVLPELLAALDDPDPEVRHEAVQDIAAAGALDAVPRSRRIALLVDPHENVFQEIEGALTGRRFGGEPLPSPPTSMRLLWDAFETVEAESSVGRRLLGAIEETILYLRRRSARSGERGDAGQAPAWHPLPSAALERLVELLRSTSRDVVRRHAARILQFGGPTGADRFLDTLLDAPPFLEEELRQRYQYHPPHRERLLEVARTAEDAARREWAAETLLRHAEHGSLPEAFYVRWFRRTAGEGGIERMLARHLGADPALAVRVLGEALRSDDEEVRAIAGRLLLDLGLQVADEELAETALEKVDRAYEDAPRGLIRLVADHFGLVRDRRSGSTFRGGRRSGRRRVRTGSLDIPRQLGVTGHAGTVLPRLLRWHDLLAGAAAEGEGETARLARAVLQELARRLPDQRGAYPRTRPAGGSPWHRVLDDEADGRRRAEDLTGEARALRRQVVADPEDAWALARLARLIATEPEATSGDPREAERLARRAIEAFGEETGWWTYDALAAALAAQERHREAVTAQIEAVRRAEDSDDRSIAHHRLLLYIRRMEDPEDDPPEDG